MAITSLRFFWIITRTTHDVCALESCDRSIPSLTPTGRAGGLQYALLTLSAVQHSKVPPLREVFRPETVSVYLLIRCIASSLNSVHMYCRKGPRYTRLTSQTEVPTRVTIRLSIRQPFPSLEPPSPPASSRPRNSQAKTNAAAIRTPRSPKKAFPPRTFARLLLCM